MKTPQMMFRAAITILAVSCIARILYHNFSFLISGLGIIEFREPDLIAICILSFVLMRTQWERRSSAVANSFALVVGAFTLLTKGLIMFFSADLWVAGWHAMTFAVGCCLFVLALESSERLKKNVAEQVNASDS